jgi:hypothetical protein
MSHYVEVCPQQPVNGVCTVATEWKKTDQFLSLSYQEFLVVLPFLVGALLGAKLVRMQAKLIFPQLF